MTSAPRRAATPVKLTSETVDAENAAAGGVPANPAMSVPSALA